MSSSGQPSERCRCMCTAGSRSPERVPITSPSSGVSPIEVSTDSPPRTAVADAPLPRCSTIMLTSSTRTPECPGGLARDIGVRGAVEPVTADVVLLAPRARDGVRVRDLRDRVVEGRVEDHHLRQVGEQLAGHRDALEVGRVVQRRQRHQRLHGRDHVVVDQGRLGELLAAVHDPVPDRDHLDVALRRPVVLEGVDRGAQRVLERRELPLARVLLPADLVRRAVRSPRRSARPTPRRAPRRSRRRRGCTSATTSPR